MQQVGEWEERQRWEDTYRIEVESVSRFLVLIRPWHTFVANFSQPVSPRRHCHLCKVTVNRQQDQNRLYVAWTAIATCPAVSTTPIVIELSNQCWASSQPPLLQTTAAFLPAGSPLLSVYNVSPLLSSHSAASLPPFTPSATAPRSHVVLELTKIFPVYSMIT